MQVINDIISEKKRLSLRKVNLKKFININKLGSIESFSNGKIKASNNQRGDFSPIG